MTNSARYYRSGCPQPALPPEGATRGGPTPGSRAGGQAQEHRTQ